MNFEELKRMKGFRVGLVFVDYRFGFWLQRENMKFEVAFEAPFLVERDDVKNFDPEDRTSLGPLLLLFDKIVEDVSVSDDWTLKINFNDGTSIISRAIDDREAWSIAGDNFLLNSPIDKP